MPIVCNPHTSSLVPSFQIFNYDSGSVGIFPSIDNLPLYIPSGSSGLVYPSLRYAANTSLVTTTHWSASLGYGETLNINAGSGVDPVIANSSPFFSSSDGSVDFGVLNSNRFNGKYYVGTTASYGDIGSEDVVIEFIGTIPTDGIRFPAFKESATDGWSLLVNSTSLYVRMIKSSTAKYCVTNTLSDNAFFHALLFVNRDEASTNGVQWYVNGIANGSGADFSSISGSLSCTGIFSLGGNVGGSCNRQISYLAMYKQQNWWPPGNNATLWSDIAKERFYRLMAFWPSYVKGRYFPTTCTRNSVASLDKFESNGTRKIFRVVANWPRVCERSGSLNSSVIRGYLPEQATTNLQKQSEYAASWANSSCYLTSSATGSLSPAGDYTALKVAEYNDSGSSVNHNMFPAAGLTMAANQSYCVSTWAKAISRSWLILRTTATGVGWGKYFNISTGATGSFLTQEPLSCSSEYWGNGWYRIWMTITSSTAPTDTSLILHLADTDGANSYIGTNKDHCYLWGAQFEAGTRPSSYIPTTTAAVTRPVDNLVYNVYNVRDKSTIKANILKDQEFRWMTHTDFVVSTGINGKRLVAGDGNFRSSYVCYPHSYEDSYDNKCYFATNTSSSVGSRGGIVGRFDYSKPESSLEILDLSLITSSLRGFGLILKDQYAYTTPFTMDSTTGERSGMTARIDRNNFTTGGVTTIDFASINPLYKGYPTGFASGSYIYYIPQSSDSAPTTNGYFIRVNINNFTTGGVEVLNLALVSSSYKGFQKGCVLGNYGYVAAYNNGSFYGTLLKIDLNNFTTGGVQALDLSTVSTGLIGFTGCFATGSYIYLSAERGSEMIAKVDSNNFTTGGVSVLSLTSSDDALRGISNIVSDGVYGYTISSNPSGSLRNGYVGKFELASFSSASKLDVSTFDPALKGFNYSICKNNKLYMFPNYNERNLYHGHIAVVDTNTFTVSGSLNFPSYGGVRIGPNGIFKKNVFDRVTKEIYTNQQFNNLTFEIDSTSSYYSGISSSAVTALNIGQDNNALNQLNGLINNLRIYPNFISSSLI